MKGGYMSGKTGYTALNSLLLFIAFITTICMLEGADGLIVSLLVLACWVGFSTYSFVAIRRDEKEK